MARNTTNQSQEHTREFRAPKYLAWHVTQKGEKAFWNKVGVAWMHKDEKGYTLQLEALPVGGRIVLRQPLEDTSTPANDEGRS
ncbi:hypothetical protein [uncultured Sneathiella sp.]|uniref:hypothetical protein n=1 Tax=uncultured Sneathiella sp. TaxID=879315 RepID=UPI0030EE33CE|tara:strand:- start:5180 stop:5428 length:249 start_codon:yes stop_codon:yes gene_type:complete